MMSWLFGASLKTFLYFLFCSTVSALSLKDNCSTSCSQWNVTITNDAELRQFVESARSKHDDGCCINLSLLGNSSYTLDIVDFMNVTSFSIANSGSLIMQAMGGTVDINCVSSQSDLDELLQILRPISNVLLVMLDGLVFNNCPVPVLIEEVSVVVVQNCVFQHHQHGALNIFNSPNVTVKNCTFYNNTSSSFFTRRPYQGNAGGLSIGYNMGLSNRPVSSVNILVTDCVFAANYAAPPTDLQVSSTELLAANIFTGRGGALALPINVTSPVDCIVTNNIFINNSAESFGGCIYSFAGGPQINQKLLFKSNEFIGNSATNGGVMTVLTSQVIPETFHTQTAIQNCTFIQNRAQICGCVNYYPHLGIAGSLIQFIDCKFYNNSASVYAGAIDIVSYRFFGSRGHEIPVQLTNCVFDGNNAPNGAAFHLGYYDAQLDNVSITNHQGSAIQVIAGKMSLHNQLILQNNDAVQDNSGALHLLSFSQVFLEPGVHLDFINNSGRLGAAIVTTLGFMFSAFEAYDNPLCFFQYYDSAISPLQWNATMTFAGNQALVGSAIYTSGLNLCSWVSNSPPHFSNTNQVLRWPFITYGDGNLNTGHSAVDSINRSLVVQTPPVNFVIQTKSVTAYPGQPINLSVFSYDEQNYITSDTVQIMGSSSDYIVSFIFSPSAKTLQPSESNFSIRYSIKTSEAISETFFNKIYPINVSSLRTHSPNEVEYFNLTVSTCPPGLALYSTDLENKFECRCDDDNDRNIIDCLPDERKLILKEGFWAHDINFGSVDGVLEYYWCPPGYCRCSSNNECNSVYYYDDNDLQCVCDRQGYLCGECRADKGVSVLLNKCVSCDYVNILIIVALIIVDVIAITTILLFSITLRPWVYPFMFYLQVTPYIAEYFPVTFNTIQPYLYYISSALSLYFPYDFCLYPGMSAVASYSFRYIPFMLTIFIFSIIYIVCSKCRITVNFRLLWAGLWLLIMLQFTNIVATSVSILNCPMLEDFDGRKSMRWYIDGTTECFTGGHAPLAIFAILVLMMCAVLIVIVTAIVMGKIMRLTMQRTLRDVYTDDGKWFVPFDLIRRYLLIIFIVIDPGNLGPVLLWIMICMAVYVYIQPYRNNHVNILETVILTDILLMLIIASRARFESQDTVFGQFADYDIDPCGDVNVISDYAVLLTPLYYFPLGILILLIIKKALDKTFINRYLSSRSQQQYNATTDDVYEVPHRYSLFNKVTPSRYTEVIAEQSYFNL